MKEFDRNTENDNVELENELNKIINDAMNSDEPTIIYFSKTNDEGRALGVMKGSAALDIAHYIEFMKYKSKIYQDNLKTN